MLTQDGRLVEIDIENIPVKKQKIRNADIHTWVNKKHLPCNQINVMKADTSRREFLVAGVLAGLAAGA
jgi:hypothetical protein